ncbi:MAG: trehalase family glycosidase [Candidatus Saccharimonadales bacterium]
MSKIQTTTVNPMHFDKEKIAEAFAYIEQKWPELTKVQPINDGTLLGLPYPFVVPSVPNGTSFAFQEMYYWDSYFIVQGLLATEHDELAAGMLENLLFMSKSYHIIPNANRTYFTSRSQAPFLTSLIFDVYDKQEKNIAWVSERLYIAQKEYENVWTNTAHPNWRNVFEGLSRYYDINLLDHLAEAESGWDMTTRFHGKCLSYIPIDLNCLLYKYETDFARGAELTGDHDNATIWQARAQKRAETVTKYLWNEEKGFFFDFDYLTHQQSEVWSIASFYALWSGLATDEQARRLVENLRHFMHRGGLSTTRSPDEYHGDAPTQWAYPNGWAPLQWLIAHGLHSYSYHTEAELVARTWLGNNLDHFASHGVFREAYNVVDPGMPPRPGLYPPQLGFGWTNAVFVDLAKKFLTPAELALT